MIARDYYYRASTVYHMSDSEVASTASLFSSPPASTLSPWLHLLYYSFHWAYRACHCSDESEVLATSHSIPLTTTLLYSPPQDQMHHHLAPHQLHTSITPGIALGSRYEVRESFAAAAARPAGGLREDYGFVATMDREISRDPERYIAGRTVKEMRELRAADRARQQQIIQTLMICRHYREKMIPIMGIEVTTLQGQVTALQGQVMALQGQVTALQGQQGPAGGPAQPELPEEAGSSS
ncbi:hypothetical protein Tco_0650490 [Tanacetum coccineum]